MAADAALLDEIRDNRTAAQADWDDIFEEARKDRLCISGRVWDAMDPKGKKQRNDARRPVLALDELGQYINQTVNDVRANPRGIKFAPTGNGANDQGAEFYQNYTREIEYRSHARVGYSTAFESAVTSGVGWLRVTTKRQHVRTFNQDLWIEPIVNANQVLPGPAVWPDSRDAKYLFYIEPWPIKAAERKFGKDIRGLSADWRGLAKQWLRKDTIDLAEYWKIEAFKRTLVGFQRAGIDPQTQQPFLPEAALVDELPNGKLPDGAQQLREEEVEDTRVKAWLTDGLNVLEEIKWLGKYLPFVSCMGKPVYVDLGSGSQREILSMTRLARDPFMLYCYYRTCEAELVGMTPKFPYFAYEGQLSPNELLNLQKSLHEPVAVIRVKPTVEGAPPNTVLAFPQRQPYEPPIQGLEVGAEAARRAIQAAMGISPLPTDAQRHNQKSGVALKQIESSGQRGSFHFVDHYELMIERTGVLLEDLIDKVVDTARDVPVRKPDDSATIVRVNDPRDPESIDTRGDYRVTISTGPATDSQRSEASDFVDTLVSNIATVAQLAGPQKAAALLAKSVKLKQLGPIGDEIVELLEPPQQMGADGKPLPPEVVAMQGQVKQLQGQLQQAGQVIQTEAVKQKALIQIQMSKEKIADIESRRRAATAIAVAKIQASAKGGITDREAQNEALALAAEQEFEATQAQLDREHETALASADAGHEAAMAELQHQHGLEAIAAQPAPEPGPAGAGV